MKLSPLILLLIGLIPCGAAPATQQPNIVLVFIDDMGWADLSCFGNKEAKTPHIDALAKGGICFDQFYVNSPICSPSRVAISTGQYPQRWDITSYLAKRQLNENRGMANWLDPQAPMLARSLKNAGYTTGHFGKWHMGGQRDVGDAPLITAYGFDQSLTNFEGLGPRLLPLIRSPKKPEFQKLWEGSEKLGRGKVTWMDRSKITGGFVSAAVAFIDQAQQNKQPFYINLWPDDVHSPFYPPLEKWKDGADTRQLYLAVLEEMDRQLGALFEKIKSDPSLRGNTLILVCSDNGHEPAAGSSGPLKGCKTSLYEGGIRSPLIVWGEGLIPEAHHGIRNGSSLICAMDLVPSLLKLAEVESDINYDGEAMIATLLGKSDISRQKAIYYRRAPDRKHYRERTNRDLAVRKGPWKLLCDFDGSNTELYHIPKDPGEADNLTKQKSELTTSLKAELLKWHTSIAIEP